MSSQMGNSLRFSLFGESHGAGVGVLMEGLPAGVRLDQEAIAAFLKRRSPGFRPGTSARVEADTYLLQSGVYQGVTTGAPLVAFFPNSDVRSQDYEAFRHTPRPSHADYPAMLRYDGFNDLRGGGHFSARLTAPWCFAGALALQILAEKDVVIGSHIAQVGSLKDEGFDPVTVSKEQLKELSKELLPLVCKEFRQTMLNAVSQVAAEGDSLGGIIEAAAVGFPGGFGNPIFENLESRLAYALFAIPGVRGVEFGSGFQATQMLGSQHNDPWVFQENQVKTKTNHHGGVLGGISTGMPILLRVAFKPTASIAKEQKTVDLQEHKTATLQIMGRHDPCITLRAAPVVEAAIALVLLDVILEGGR